MDSWWLAELNIALFHYHLLPRNHYSPSQLTLILTYTSNYPIHLINYSLNPLPTYSTTHSINLLNSSLNQLVNSLTGAAANLSTRQHINFLLTGASGFLGNYCLPVLAAQPGTLYTLGRRQPAGVGAQQHIRANLATDVPVLPQALDTVVHVAGLAHTIGQAADSQHFEVNAEGTRHLLRALQQSGMPRQFVYISTVAVYGLVQGENITEDQPIRPTTAYGTSKAKAEEWILEWCARHGVGCCILRLPLVYGPQAPGHWQQMIEAMQRGRYFQIGQGTARKSMVAAADVAAFLPQAFTLQGIYHLTDGVHPTLAEVHAALAGQLRVPPPTRIPFWLAQSIAQLGSGLNALLGKSIFPLHRATLQKLTLPLTFSDAKVRAAATWNPGSVVEQLAVGGMQ